MKILGLIKFNMKEAGKFVGLREFDGMIPKQTINVNLTYNLKYFTGKISFLKHLFNNFILVLNPKFNYISYYFYSLP